MCYQYTVLLYSLLTALTFPYIGSSLDALHLPTGHKNEKIVALRVKGVSDSDSVPQLNSSRTIKPILLKDVCATIRAQKGGGGGVLPCNGEPAIASHVMLPIWRRPPQVTHTLDCLSRHPQKYVAAT